MEFFKKLIEKKVEATPELIGEEWHSVEGVQAQVGDYLLSAEGYYDETELYVNIYNTNTKEQYRAEVYRNGNNFDISMNTRKNGRSKPLDDGELSDFLKQLTLSFVQKNYDKILTPPDYGMSDNYDSYENRRERMRQGREMRSELDYD